MADSKVSDLTANTEPEARDLFYHVDLSESDTDDQSKKVTFASMFNSVIVMDDEVVFMDDDIVTL